MPHSRWFLTLAVTLFVSVSSMMADQNIPVDFINSYCKMTGLTAKVTCNWHRTQQPCGSLLTILQPFNVLTLETNPCVAAALMAQVTAA